MQFAFLLRIFARGKSFTIAPLLRANFGFATSAAMPTMRADNHDFDMQSLEVPLGPGSREKPSGTNALPTNHIEQDNALARVRR